MQSSGKKPFIIVALLSGVCVILSGFLWYQLSSVNTEKDAIETELKRVEAEQSQIAGRYSELREQINVRLGRGQDAKSFITLDDPAVAAIDKLRYQTIYAKVPGAVAAPTAGLHFTDQLIEQLKQQGIYFAYITLHVGIGTFRPITVECLDDHKMHPEPFTIDNENASIINQAKDKGGRIIAVGTTTVRTLESVAAGSQIKAASPVRTPRLRHDGLRWRLASNGASGQATLFIKPGYKFKIIDAMITNFHLPKSTLLALVAAFAGLEKILIAYKHAIQQKYRFYSYGDAMLII